MSYPYTSAPYQQCRCPKGCGHSGHPNLNEGANVQVSEQPSPEYDQDKGQPYRQLRKRARYIADDLSDAEAATVLQQMISAYPQQAADVLCKFWEKQIEAQRGTD